MGSAAIFVMWPRPHSHFKLSHLLRLVTWKAPHPQYYIPSPKFHWTSGSREDFNGFYHIWV